MPAPPVSVLLLALASILLGGAQLCLLVASGDRDGVLLTFAALVPLGFIATIVAAGRAAWREHERLARVATTDDLTGFGNARGFREDLRRELARSRRSGRPLTLTMVDLDGLKATNDSLGHQAGDARIRALAEALSGEARTYDGVYRLGGDEFACLLPDVPVWGGVRFAQRVEERLAAGAEPSSATFGLAEARGSADPELLVRQADLALIEGKRIHRSMTVYAEDFEVRHVAGPSEAEDVHRGTLATALARAVDAKDSYTSFHCETVATLCTLIGTGLGLAPEELARLRLAGLLHDVGKIGVDDAVLGKPGALTDAEYAHMQTHVTVGHGIVVAADLGEEAEWVLHHHERVDGRGYPDGLAGDAIPLQSRIILVADAFEAMTSDRPYRRGSSDEQALAELREHAGTQFDPDCVAALEQALAGAAAVPAVARV